MSFTVFGVTMMVIKAAAPYVAKGIRNAATPQNFKILMRALRSMKNRNKIPDEIKKIPNEIKRTIDDASVFISYKDDDGGWKKI